MPKNSTVPVCAAVSQLREALDCARTDTHSFAFQFDNLAAIAASVETAPSAAVRDTLLRMLVECARDASEAAFVAAARLEGVL